MPSRRFEISRESRFRRSRVSPALILPAGVGALRSAVIQLEDRAQWDGRRRLGIGWCGQFGEEEPKLDGYDDSGLMTLAHPAVISAAALEPRPPPLAILPAQSPARQPPTRPHSRPATTPNKKK